MGAFYKIKDGFELRRYEGKTFAVPALNSGLYFNGTIELNPLGEFMFIRLQNGTTIDKLADEIMVNFTGAERRIVVSDIQRFVDQLEGAGLIDFIN